ncbi:MAG: bifunctional riboflavin kinase/FAD synthetase [Clostridia bacterium]|nr:bifunctional riboflavin kinase/FAD synthetase [Clostridia bacterium]
MQILEKKYPAEDKRRVVALGNFDGVHMGHTELIKQAVRLAKQNGYECCVYTFKDHPSNFKHGVCALLTDNAEKAEIISELGADLLYLEEFEDVKDLSCAEFCRDILVKKLGCQIAVCGENFCFGKERCGNCTVLKEEMEKLGGSVEVCSHICDKNGDVVNSTSIRKMILAGDMEKATEYLGRPYSINYPVVHGRHLGTKMGIPTINQNFSQQKLVPAHGVYACICHADGKKYCGVANVGTKPTVTDKEKAPPVLCETHIIGFSGDLYGKYVRVEFVKRLRDERKFSSLEELISAVKENIKETKALFAHRKDILL